MGVAKRMFKLSITNEIPTSALADLVVCIVFAIHALFWVALRIGARVYTRTKLQFNDYAIFWAIFWGLALAGNSITTVSYGGPGHHISEIAELAPESIVPMLKVSMHRKAKNKRISNSILFRRFWLVNSPGHCQI